MAEITTPSFVEPTPHDSDTLGRVQLAPEVLEVIIGIATTEVDGVANTRGNFASGVAEKFGKVMYGKGVKTKWCENGLIVDVYCKLHKGYSVRDVALNVQKQVRHAIYHMTLIETNEVNVHITGIEFEAGSETGSSF